MNAQRYRNAVIHGKSPAGVVAVHGGPGAAGEMRPLARELSRWYGVLEPLQTATSVDAQIEELRDAVQAYAKMPCTMIGFSWGAWLVCLAAARYPGLSRKLILVGSGPFEARYAEGIDDLRMSRLSEEERAEITRLMPLLESPSAQKRMEAFSRFGALFFKADAYDPLDVPEKKGVVELDPDIFNSVWPEAARLRASDALMETAGRIQCPVRAIHGEYDSHPAEGVVKPLAGVLEDFRHVILDKCGHKPWVERWARDEFYRVLLHEIDEQSR